MISDIARAVFKKIGPESTLSDDSALIALHQLLERHALSEFLPYCAEEEGIFINKKSLGFVLQALPIIGSSESMEKKLNNLFRHDLPPGANIQFLFVASPKIGDHLQRWLAPRKAQGGALYEIAKSRVAHFERLALMKDKPYCARDIRILISVSQPGNAFDVVAIEKMKQLKGKVLSNFTNIHMQAEALDARGLMRSLFELLNPNDELSNPDRVCNSVEPLNTQLIDFDTEIKIEKQAIHWPRANKQLRLYGVKRYPEQWLLSEMNHMIGDFFDSSGQINVPFCLHYGVHICDEKMLKSKILAKCTNVEKQANSVIAKWIPSIKKEAQEWSYVRHQFERGERLVRTQFKAMLLCDTCAIENAESQLKGLFKSKGWELGQEYLTVLLSFLSCLPMNWGEGGAYDQKRLGKLKTTLSHEPVNLLPIQGEWHGTHSPGMLLTGIRGQVFSWSGFDNRSGNFNIAVVGKSGSGKSVFMQEMVCSNLGMGGRAFVLDVGRSFERLAKLNHGAFIEFGIDSQICINPFTNIPTDKLEETQDALAMLKPVVALMAAPTQGVSDLENSLIEKAIANAWLEKQNQATITDISAKLFAMDELEAKKLSKMLYSYTQEGIYGRFFEGAANIDLSAQMVVLEMEELKERKDLQAVMVQMMILEITNQVYMGDRRTPVYLVLDEAWDLLRGKQAGEFIETAARRLRKYKGALVTGTQSVNDFYQTPGAQASFENSDWLVLLEQKASSIQQLKESKRIGEMSSYMEKVLKYVHTIKGEYAEALIYGPDGFAVGRLFLDRYSQLVYTTSADEVTEIQKYMDAGLSLEQTLEALSHV